jgi:hypothetical protein
MLFKYESYTRFLWLNKRERERERGEKCKLVPWVWGCFQKAPWVSNFGNGSLGV